MVDHVLSMDQMDIIVNVDPDIAALIVKVRIKFQMPHNHFPQKTIVKEYSHLYQIQHW